MVEFASSDYIAMVAIIASAIVAIISTLVASKLDKKKMKSIAFFEIELKDIKEMILKTKEFSRSISDKSIRIINSLERNDDKILEPEHECFKVSDKILLELINATTYFATIDEKIRNCYLKTIGCLVDLNNYLDSEEIYTDSVELRRKKDEDLRRMFVDSVKAFYSEIQEYRKHF